jgi:predicted metal-dependent phosphoesterase TrpH
LERHIDVFDAIEYAQVHLPWLNPNKRAVRIAQKHGKPIVANSDAHNLWMFGRHYTLVDAEPTQASIFRAIREGRLKWHSPPISVSDCLRMFIFDPSQRRPGKTVKSFD